MPAGAAPLASPLHVVERGAAVGGPLVVVVHGSMDRSAGWARVVGRLRDHHVIRYDRRGYGRSQGAGTAVGVDGHVEDLLGVIDAHRPAGRSAVVVGHSFGGVVALAAAARHPAVIAAVGAFEAPMPWLPWWPTPARKAGETRSASSDAPGDVAEAFLRRMLGDDRWEALPASTRRARRAEGEALVAEMGSLRTGAPFGLHELTVPVVAGHGTRSSEHHQRAAAVLAESTSGHAVAVEGADHGAHLTHPAEVADFVRTVIAARQRRAALTTAGRAPVVPATTRGWLRRA